jgi:hypothetical protein
MASVLESFIFIFHWRKYLFKEFKPVWRLFEMIFGLCEEVKQVVSSAYKAREHSFGLGRSFMNELKRIGPRMLPRGTPAEIVFGFDKVLLTVTTNVRCLIYERIIFMRYRGTFKVSNLWRSSSCHTVSKAFSLSRTIMSVFLF